MQQRLEPLAKVLTLVEKSNLSKEKDLLSYISSEIYMTFIGPLNQTVEKEVKDNETLRTDFYRAAKQVNQCLDICSQTEINFKDYNAKFKDIEKRFWK